MVLPRRLLVGLFTSDDGLQRTAERLLLALYFILVVDASSSTSCGVLSGLGLQYHAAKAQLIGFYFVGMPIAVAFAFLPVAYGGTGGSGTRGATVIWLGVALSMLASVAIQLSVGASMARVLEGSRR